MKETTTSGILGYMCGWHDCREQAHSSYVLEGKTLYCCGEHRIGVAFMWKTLTGRDMPFTDLPLQLGTGEKKEPVPVAWRQKRRQLPGYILYDFDPLEVHDNGMPVEPLYLKEDL